MNIDYAFEATPAKCRLLLSLTQYDFMRIEITEDLINIANQDLLPTFFNDIEKQQVYQFLADIGDRAVIVKKTMNEQEINLSFMVQAAKDLGYTDIIVLATIAEGEKAIRHIDTTIPVFNSFDFCINDSFIENTKIYENYLIIYKSSYVHDNLFRHFKKIWSFVDWQDFQDLSSFKQANSLTKSYAYDPIHGPTLYNGMFEINGKITYFPKFKIE